MQHTRSTRPWRFRKGWRLGEQERPRVRWVLAGWGVAGWLRGLLSRRRFRVTRISHRARALWQEVLHGLRLLMCFCEPLSKTCYRRSKEAVGGNRWNQGRGPCLRPWFPSAWATGGTRAPPGWPRTSLSPGRWSWWRTVTGLLHFSAPWESQDQAQTCP